MTIDERAKKFVEKRTHMPFKQAIEYQGSTYVNVIMQSYIDVATEQKKIDIENLKDALDNNRYVEDELEDGWLSDTFVERIIKAMEE